MDRSCDGKAYRIIVYATILMLPFSWMTLPRIGSAYRAFTILCVLYFLSKTGLRIPIYARNKALFVSWLLFLCWAGFSLIWATNEGNSYTTSFGYILILLLSVVFMVSAEHIDTNKMDDIWIAMGVIWILLYFLTGTTRFSTSSRTTLVILGNETDNNEFAGTLIVPASVLLFKLIKGCDIKRTIAYAGALIVIAYVVLMTGSRGGAIALAIAIVTTALLSGKFTVKQALLCLLLLAAVSILIWRYVLPLIPKDIILRFTSEELESGGEGRTSKWFAALDAINKSDGFRFLCGYGAFGYVVLNKTSTMHNQFVQVLLDYGVIGLVLYLNLLVCSSRAVWKRNRRYAGAFIGMMVLCMSITTGPAYKPLWIFLMICFLPAEER